jgi:hypothetical protein
MYGYDAGVLGGVQATEPFLNAIGVRALHAKTFPPLTIIRTPLENMSFPW